MATRGGAGVSENVHCGVHLPYSDVPVLANAHGNAGKALAPVHLLVLADGLR